MRRRTAAWLLMAFALVIPAFPSSADACPRCAREGLERSVVEGEFLNFQRITRTLRVRVSDESGSWEDRVVVVGGVRPERGEERVSWGDLERGSRVRLEVHESPQDRYVVRVKILEGSS